MAAAPKSKKRVVSDEHKAAMAAGRTEARAVKNYLDALELTRPKRGRKRTPDSINARLEKINAELIGVQGQPVDMGGYYRIPADNRDLNYAKYFSEGETDISTLDDYTSHNTKRLNVEEVKSLLMTLDYIKDELHA